MGEFFDVLLQTGNEQGRLFLETLREESNDEEFEIFREKMFDHKHVSELCDGVAEVMSEHLKVISSCAEHSKARRLGHQFLEEIGDISAELGVDFGPRGTDRNVTVQEIAEAIDILSFVENPEMLDTRE